MTIFFTILAGFIGLLFLQKFFDIVIIGKKHRWSIGIYRGDTPFNLRDPKDINNPVLTRSEVCDINAKFVADPFMVKDNGNWWLFFEVLDKDSKLGKIGVASSTDTKHWQYHQVVLDEPFHLSYPHIIKWQDDYYMIPESGKGDASVRLYKATRFPYEWEFQKKLLTGKPFADATLIHRNGKWWMFVSESSHDTLSIYFAEQLDGPYQAHPNNPVVANNKITARPGGSILNYDGKLIRFAQQAEPWYGKALWAIEISTLTETDFSEQLFMQKPVLEGSPRHWNELRMHHLDAHQLEDRSWIAAVDGGGKHHFRWVDKIAQHLFFWRY